MELRQAVAIDVSRAATARRRDNSVTLQDMTCLRALVNALSGSEADERLDGNRRPNGFSGVFQRPLDRLVRVQHKRLHAEHDVLVELAHATFKRARSWS